jgi:vancomycin resistance protein YoaR
VNGTVVQPGEVFSLDAVTGPRTAANGYVEAGVIDNGRSARGIAGGASQVSTTLYNASYLAGMTLIEHKAHSFYISRYPAGREATIATGAIDNKFRNDNPTPIMIRTRWTPSSVTVQIYGQRKYEVTGEFGPRTNPTQPNEVTIPSGEDCHASNGAPGFTITDTRTRRDVDTGEVKKETITTRYNPAPKVVCED